MGRFQELARAIVQDRERQPSMDVFAADDPVVIERFIEQHLSRPHLPRRGESVAVTTRSHKTAALFFDRVWGATTIGIPFPSEVLAWGATDAEVTITALAAAGADSVGQQLADDLRQTTSVEAPLRVSIAAALTAQHGVNAVPVYQAVSSRAAEFQPGHYEILIAAITDLAVVDDSKLTWDQVLEFRSDAESRSDYRRMLHWLDREMVGKSTDFIRDEIAERLERYRAALRKHGVTTTTGVVEAVIDPKFLGTVAAVGGAAALAGQATAALASAAALVAARVGCTVARGLAQAPDTRFSTDGVVAYVHQISQRSK